MERSGIVGDQCPTQYQEGPEGDPTKATKRLQTEVMC